MSKKQQGSLPAKPALNEPELYVFTSGDIFSRRAPYHHHARRQTANMVEPIGIEPMTSSLQS